MKFVPVVLLMSTIGASPAFGQAQDNNGSSTPAVRITPFVSVGSNASSGVGASVRWYVAPKLSIEVETALREAEVTGLTSSIGLVYDLPSIGSVTPYVVGGVGFEQYGTVAETPFHGLITLKKTAFTVNAGAGVRVPIDEKWGYGADARWSNGIGREAPERWRVYNGVSFGAGRR